MAQPKLQVSNEIKIDKGVPLVGLSGRGKHGNAKYPWREMEVGDSFFVSTVSMGALSAQGQQAGLRLNRKFKTKTFIENGVKGVRVWRIA